MAYVPVDRRAELRAGEYLEIQESVAAWTDAVYRPHGHDFPLCVSRTEPSVVASGTDLSHHWREAGNTFAAFQFLSRIDALLASLQRPGWCAPLDPAFPQSEPLGVFILNAAANRKAPALLEQERAQFGKQDRVLERVVCQVLDEAWSRFRSRDCTPLQREWVHALSLVYREHGHGAPAEKREDLFVLPYIVLRRAGPLEVAVNHYYFNGYYEDPERCRQIEHLPRELIVVHAADATGADIAPRMYDQRPTLVVGPTLYWQQCRYQLVDMLLNHTYVQALNDGFYVLHTSSERVVCSALSEATLSYSLHVSRWALLQ